MRQSERADRAAEPADGDDDDDGVVLSADGRRVRPVKSLRRAAHLLDALAAAPGGLGLTALAQSIATSKTATYNLLSTLELTGLVRRDERQQYCLGWRLLEYGEAVRATWSLGEAARALVVELAERAGETALLAILDADTVFCVEMVESGRSTPIDHGPGRRTDPRADAAGLVLLAFDGRGTRPGSRPDGLADRLDRVRREGHAIVETDHAGGLTTIAAPVTDYRRRTVAAVSVVGPGNRLPASRCAELVPLVVRSAAAISAALGARGR